MVDVLSGVYHTQHKLHKTEYVGITYALDLLKAAANTRRQLLDDVSGHDNRNHVLVAVSEELRLDVQKLQSQHAQTVKARDDLLLVQAQLVSEIETIKVCITYSCTSFFPWESTT